MRRCGDSLSRAASRHTRCRCHTFLHGGWRCHLGWDRAKLEWRLRFQPGPCRSLGAVPRMQHTYIYVFVGRTTPTSCCLTDTFPLNTLVGLFGGADRPSANGVRGLFVWHVGWLALLGEGSNFCFPALTDSCGRRTLGEESHTFAFVS